MEEYQDISVRIGGVAGDGSLFTGEIIALVLKRRGFYVVSVRDFPSNIRGLPTNLTIRGNIRRIYSWSDEIDVLVAFEPYAFNKHAGDLKRGAFLIFDDEFVKEKEVKKDVVLFPVPLRKLSRELYKNEIFKNVIALGIVGYYLSISLDEIRNVILDRLKGKKEEIIRNNISALEKGYELGKSLGIKRLRLANPGDPGRYFISGNEGVALGAIAGGCRFFSAYPITPSTEVFEFLAKHIHKFGGITVQAEDEIAGINLAIGASYAGVRAMTSTSGPGMALKTEALSLAAEAEVPLVIYHAQRGGPSTGIPTKTGQEDLNHVLFAGHGDVGRCVMVPSTPEESYEFTYKAFNIAEKYQMPVIVVSEQAISQNQQTIDKLPGNLKWERGKLLTPEKVREIYKEGEIYERYELTEDGISRRAIPGTKGIIVRYNSNEHTPEGFIDEYTEFRNQMVEKRRRKLEKLIEDVPEPILYGDENALYMVVAIGSSMGPVLEAIDRLKKEGINVSFLRIRTLFPLHEEKIYEYTKNKEKIFIAELNSFAQLRGYLSRIWGLREGVHSILRYDGLPFKPRDIYLNIKQSIKKERV
jgi:2-oxoglutarate ferredoxin oxidoreductase subunit alpha